MNFQLPLFGFTERKVPQRLSDMFVRPCNLGCYFNEKGACYYNPWACDGIIPGNFRNPEPIEVGDVCLHPEYADCDPEDLLHDPDFYKEKREWVFAVGSVRKIYLSDN